MRRRRGGGGGQGAHCAPPPKKMEARNLGKMREEFGQNSGKKWRGKNKETTEEKKSGKFIRKERKISCTLKSIKLFENNS